MNKILIIFPQYSSTQASHYPYWYQLFDQAAKTLNLGIFFETAKSKPKFKHIKDIVVENDVSKPFNLILRFFLLLRLRLQGYRNVYIHYSYFSVFICKLISFILPWQIYYWDCEFYKTNPQNLFLTMALRWSDVLVTGEESIANQYRKIFGLKNKSIKIVNNWSEYQSTHKLNLSKKISHILFVHHLSPRKGSRLLPSIIIKTLNALPQTHFHIIGDGPDKEWLQKNLSKLITPIDQPGITLYGSLSLDRVYQYFASCNMFIMPSLSEGFPRVILEAMQYKLPFVASKVGCVESIVSIRQKKYLVEPGNEMDFVKTLIKLYKANNQQIVEDNYIKAQIYSLDNVVKQFCCMFEN